MGEVSLRLQLESLEQQLKILKAKVLKQASPKKLSDLYGTFEGQLDLSSEDIRKYEYPTYDKT